VSGGDRLAAYLVRGDDPVLRGEALRRLVHDLVGEGDPALVVEEVDGAGTEEGAAATVAATVDAASTPPFLADHRVVVVRDVGLLPTRSLGPLLAYLAAPLDTTSLVLVDGGGRVTAAGLVKAVKAVGHVVDAAAPTGAKGRAAWLDRHLRDAPVRLDAGTRALVDQHLGEDLGRLANLLETLAAAYGVGARLGPEDVEAFLGEAGSVPPWELTDAVDRGDTAAALAALHRLLGAGARHPLQLMATLHAHYARILRLDGAGAGDEAAAAAMLGLRGSTYPARKALSQARRLGHDGVAEAFRLLARADRQLRGDGPDWPEELVLEVLVARLSRLGGRARPARR
jgi:DNA polymerase-3 subunit delta